MRLYSINNFINDTLRIFLFTAQQMTKKPQLILDFAKHLRQTKIHFTWHDTSILLNGLRIVPSQVHQYGNIVLFITIYPIDTHFYHGYKNVSYCFPCNNLNTLIQRLNKYTIHYKLNPSEYHDTNRKQTA